MQNAKFWFSILHSAFCILNSLFMKVAILDLGTNTFHLLIADVFSDNTFRILLKTRATVKLGKYGFGKNEISAGRFQKGIKTVQHFNEQIVQHGVKRIVAIATSAIRSSTNGAAFVQKVKDETGIKIQVISGDEEAELICLGIRQCIRLTESPVLMMDIGGGSTEFIIANHKTIFWKQSFNIGAARLLDQFHPSDPMSPDEITTIQKYLEQELKPLQQAIKKFPVSKLIGSSGSFESLAEIISYRFTKKNVLKTKQSYLFNLKEYKLVHEWLLKSTTAMRLKTKGLVRMRVDMIVLSSICTNYILKKYKMKEMVLSKFALKEGVLWNIIHR